MDSGPQSGSGAEPAMLAVIPVRDGALPLGAEETVAEAGGVALLVGSDCPAAAADLAALASHIWHYEMVEFQVAAWAEAIANALADTPGLADRGHLLLPASPDGRDLGPHLAVALGRDFVPAAIAISAEAAEMTRFGGRVTDTLQLTGPVVATLQPGVRGVGPADQQPSPPVLEPAVTATSPAPKPAAVTLVEQLAADPSTMDLAEADRIIGGGAGLGSAEAFDELKELADQLGASTGGTRVVTDWGWLPIERQIGTTGVTVDPSLYIAIGISGAVQHTAGLGAPSHIVSVNSDPHCPMMGMADLAIVCDGPAFLTALIARLELAENTQAL